MDADNNGCRDYRRLRPDTEFGVATIRRGLVRISITIDRLEVRNLPSRSRVQIRCSRSSICRKDAKLARRSGRVTFPALVGEKLRPGQQIFLRVTKRLAIGTVVTLEAQARGEKAISEAIRCIDPRSGRIRACRRVETRR